MKKPDDALHPDGFLDDDFARFRAQRLRERKTRSMRAVDQVAETSDESEADESEPKQPDEGLFFGTSSSERRRIKAEEGASRAAAEVDAVTRRILRRQERAS